MAAGLKTKEERSSHALIITFVGPVGVGKSTHMKLLQNHLASRGGRVVATFIKSSHALTYVLNIALMALGASEETHYKTQVSTSIRSDIFARLLPLWCFLDTLSIAGKFFVRVYIPFKLGFTVLIEEGPAMTLLSYYWIFPQLFKAEARVPRLVPNLLGWIQKNEHVDIILDASDEDLVRRRESRDFRRDELPQYVDLQRRWIEHLNFRNTLFINTRGESIAETQEKIISALDGILNPFNA